MSLPRCSSPPGGPTGQPESVVHTTFRRLGRVSAHSSCRHTYVGVVCCWRHRVWTPEMEGAGATEEEAPPADAFRAHTYATSELSAELAAARDAIVAEVADEDERGAVPYHLQVDTSMYTREAKLKRLALKRHPRVAAAVTRWHLLVGYDALPGQGTFEGVGHRTYMRLSGAVFTALLGTDTDAATLHERWVGNPNPTAAVVRPHTEAHWIPGATHVLSPTAALTLLGLSPAGLVGLLQSRREQTVDIPACISA